MKVIIEGFKVDKDHLRFLDKGTISKTGKLVYYNKEDRRLVYLQKVDLDMGLEIDVVRLSLGAYTSDAYNAGANLVCLKFIEEKE